MSGIEQAIGALVIFGGAFVALAYVGGFVWYSCVSYPLGIRRARSMGIVIVGTDVFGDDTVVDFVASDWRRATFAEWRKVKTYDDERPQILWPTRPFA